MFGFFDKISLRLCSKQSTSNIRNIVNERTLAKMEINCEFSDPNWFTFKISGDIAKFYTCSVENVEHPITANQKFIGNHDYEKSNADVKVIEFIHCKFKHFPRDLHKSFPQIQQLSFLNCGIETISRHEMRGLENLLRLSIANCALKSLPDDLFDNMPKLKGVFLNDNKIVFASSKLLKPLIGRSNVIVNLKGNTAINAQYWPQQPNTLKSLGELMDIVDKQCKKPAFSKEPYDVAELIEDFNSKIKELWTSGRFSDLTIFAGAKEFKVHKNILGMQSPVFAKIIEDHNEVKEFRIFGDFTPKAVENLLHFMYTGEIKDEDNASENFLIAVKFQIAKMKETFEKILCNQLDDDNALDIFLLAHRHSAELLKQEAFDVICSQFQEDISPQLMENPEKLKKLIDNRREYEELLKVED